MRDRDPIRQFSTQDETAVAVAELAQSDRCEVWRGWAPRDLIGREREVAVLRQMLRDGSRGSETAVRGLVVRGEAGMGKSALLSEAVECARGQRIAVLKVTGAEAEADIAFSGLHSLLRPILDGADRLEPPQRAAIAAAFATHEASAAGPFVLGLATLELLAGAAVADPLLLAVEDGHWLDSPTIEVLTFVARRLSSERVVLLIASTDGHGRDFDIAGLPELRLAGLDDAAAAKLLDARAPALSSTLRSRVIAQAAGNPLALCELSASLQAAAGTDGPPSTPLELPLGERLTRAFSVRLAGQSEAARRLLLFASCDDGALVAEAVAAAELMGESNAAAVEAIAAAVDAGIVTGGGPRMRVAHPLVRAAIYQGAGSAARRAAHAAMSEVVRREPYRRAWHRALSVVGPDDEIAAELHEAAGAARSEGRIADAFAAFERAAWLTDDTGARTRSLLGASEAAFELTWPDVGRRLVLAAGGRGLEHREKELVACARRTLGDGQGGNGEIEALLRYAEVEPDRCAARRMVFRAAVNSLFAEPDERLHGAIVATAEAVGLGRDDPWHLAIMAGVGPASLREDTFERLGKVPAASVENADVAFALGFAATATCQDERAAEWLSHAVDGFRAQDRVVALTQALTLRAWAEIGLSHLEAATFDAEEASALAASIRQPLWQARALAASALLAAMRGDDAAVEQLAEAADRLAVPRRGASAIADVLAARGHAALAHGRHAEAARALAGLYDDHERISTPTQRLAAIGDFAEACVRTDSSAAAEAALADLSRTLPSAMLVNRPEFAYAHALLADDRNAEARFRAALEPASRLSPFVRARIRLAFGTFLRRKRRVVESREPLESAAAVFEALGATPWAQRARQELRATGVHCRRGSTSALELTPQETLIAQMAANGLSNQQIGQRLFLSPRTVGAHLYRIFPKLGVATRGELHGALADEDVPIAV